MKTYTFILDLFLLCLVALTGWLVWSSSQYTEKSAPSDNKTMDVFITNIDTLQYTETGQKKYHLTAPKIKHYLEDASTNVEQPIFDIYTTSGEPWQVTSELALIIDDGEQIDLINNVEISGLHTETHKNTKLTTSKATYYPSSNTADTDADVTINQPGTNIDATGMEAFFNDGNIKLLSNVKGSYNPDVKPD
jgi:lipopolysaccharide export system protein LptC